MRRHSFARCSFAIILVGKNSLLREGLAKILRSANFRILASVTCADDLLTSKSLPRRLLFLMVHTGDNFDAAIEQIELVRARHPDGSIGIVTDRYRLDELVSAFRAGANGYFVDVMTSEVFIKSLELVMMGQTVFPPAFLSFVFDAESYHLDEAGPRHDYNEAVLIKAEDTIAPQLSPREQSILRCLIEGDSNKSIARKIDIGEATVKVHVKSILRKIRVHNRTQAAIWWMNNGSSPARQLGTIRSTSNANKGDQEEIPEIKQITTKVPLSPVSDETNHPSCTDHFGRKTSLKAEGLTRLRK